MPGAQDREKGPVVLAETIRYDENRYTSYRVPHLPDSDLQSRRVA
jgi:hypothetical protein